jgi:hypothetical protein
MGVAAPDPGIELVSEPGAALAPVTTPVASAADTVLTDRFESSSCSIFASRSCSRSSSSESWSRFQESVLAII